MLIEDKCVVERERNEDLCFRLKSGGSISGGPQPSECSFDHYLVWLFVNIALQYLKRSTKKSLLYQPGHTWSLTTKSELAYSARTAEGKSKIQSQGI